MEENIDLHYPIGKYQPLAVLTLAHCQQYITDIAQAPQQLKEAVSGLSPLQMDTAYRPGGWTVKQVVHHVPDSHLNGYVRFKMALTEESPAIKLYDEKLWAELYDVQTTSVEVSLNLLENLHHRWVSLLRALSLSDLQRTITHPQQGMIKLDRILGLYAWHGKHHTAHITTLRERMGWK